MSLFKNFNGNPKSTQKSDEQNHFITNSEDLGLGKLKVPFIKDMDIDAMFIKVYLEEYAKKQNLSFKYSIFYSTLLEDGVLSVPLVCSIGNKKYSVYIIYNDDDLMKYYDLTQKISMTEYPELIFFSTKEVSTYNDKLEKKSSIIPFNINHLYHDKKNYVEGNYALWWKTKNDSDFLTSDSLIYIGLIYKCQEYYAKLLAAISLYYLGISEQLILRELPDQHVNISLIAPEEKNVLLHISKERGVIFLFHLDTPQKYRELFLKGIASFFLKITKDIELQGFTKDAYTYPNGIDIMNNIIKYYKQHKIKYNEVEDNLYVYLSTLTKK